MSVEARLQALAQNYRAQHGDSGLLAAPQLIAQLTGQAPDLYGEIRALAAAIEAHAATRITLAADQQAEAGRVAAEIAASEKLSMGAATTGVAVARALGPIGGAAAPAMPPIPQAAPAPGGWAGDSVVVGAPAAGGYVPPPPQQPYGQTPGYPPAAGYVPPGSMPMPVQAATPIYKNPVAIVAAVAAIAVGGYYVSQRPAPTPKAEPAANEQGPLAGGQQDGPGQQGGETPTNPQGGEEASADSFPTLVGRGDLPTLPINSAPNGLAIPFTMETQAGPALGAVILPTGGWEAGPASIIFGAAGETTGRGQVVNQGTARMQRIEGQTAGRLGQVQWQRDGLNIGPICVAFVGQSGRNGDVGLAGTTMCVTDATCQGDAVCGRVGQLRR